MVFGIPAAAIAAGASVLSAGYGAYAGERGAAQQKKGLRRQQAAQSQVEARSIADTRKAELAQQRAQRQADNLDVGSILLGEQGKGLPTLLTGQEGDEVKSLTLGKRNLLGRSG